MKRSQKLKRRNSDEGLNIAYRDSECELDVCDEDTVFEMVRKRKTTDKLQSRVPVVVENIGEQHVEEQPAVLYV